MYVYVIKNIDKMMAMASHLGKMSLQEVSVAKRYLCLMAYVKVSATVPIFCGSYHAEKATMAGIWSRQT